MIISAACSDGRHAPHLRNFPPALALRPVQPLHYALLPTNDRYHKTEIYFSATGILSRKNSPDADKNMAERCNRQDIRHACADVFLKTPDGACQNVAICSEKCCAKHNLPWRAA
jgi:hypothetical protein